MFAFFFFLKSTPGLLVHPFLAQVELSSSWRLELVFFTCVLKFFPELQLFFACAFLMDERVALGYGMHLTDSFQRFVFNFEMLSVCALMEWGGQRPWEPLELELQGVCGCPERMPGLQLKSSCEQSCVSVPSHRQPPC